MALGVLVSLLRESVRKKHRSCLSILTVKKGPKGYYKGKNCIPTGRHTSKGKYILIAERLPKYVVPDLSGFTLKPYVEHNTPKELPTTEQEASSS